MMEMAKDYYDVLGIGKNASLDQIKNAYRELALRFHPDKNKSKDAEEKFKEINEAYAVLSDPEKRRQYDAFGPAGFEQRFTEEDIFRGFNFEDIFRDMQENLFGAGMGGPFSDIFSGGGMEQNMVNLQMSFDDIERGIDREFQVQRYKTCSNCKGTGGEAGSKLVKCPACDGKGSRHVRQNIPFGVFDAITVCSSCGGRGKVYEKACRVCEGRGRTLVIEKFRVKVERSGPKGSKSKGFFGVF